MTPDKLVKVCGECNIEKVYTEFYWKINKTKTKLISSGALCKECFGEKNKIRNETNKDKVRVRCKKYREENREAILLWKRQYNFDNREAINKKHRNYYNKNKDLFLFHCKKRKAIKLKAIPGWANLNEIKRIYELRETMTVKTGVEHHVDHIIPLQGKTVCGLHVEYNLRVIPAKENLRKNNILVEELINV